VVLIFQNSISLLVIMLLIGIESVTESEKPQNIKYFLCRLFHVLVGGEARGGGGGDWGYVLIGKETEGFQVSVRAREIRNEAREHSKREREGGRVKEGHEGMCQT
jgi:hypothetical protein